MVDKFKKNLYLLCVLSICAYANINSYANISPSIAQADDALVVELPDQKANQFVKEARLRNLILIIAAIALVFIAFAIFIVVYKRKSTEEEAGEIKEYKEAYLVDLFNATDQQNYHITEKPVMLGRVAGRDPEFMQYIVLASSGIGRRHAVIEYKDYSFWLVDQGSINGSFVNDQPVRTEIRLKHGDRVRVYKDEFEFVIPGMEKEEATLIAGKDENNGELESAFAATVVSGEALGEEQNYDAEDVMDLGFGTEMEADVTEAPDVETDSDVPINLASLSVEEDDFDMSLEQAPEPTTEMADMLFADDIEEDDEATLLPEADDDEATLLPDMVEDDPDVTITPEMDDDDDVLENDVTLRPEK